MTKIDNKKLNLLKNIDFEKLKNIDIITVDKEELVDIKDINIDSTLPYELRILNYIEQIKNPYCYKIGDVVVKIEFDESENALTFEECINNYIKGL